jgi:pyruvate dehydrogenase E2 component (dihydrolipoamide acetyltransferase)
MGEIKRFNLPDVGEGLTEAEILAWSVKVGDIVKTNQILVEIETAKAAVELPSPYAGKVVELLVAEGETVDVGTPIIGIDIDPSTPTAGGAGGDDMVAGVAATAEAKAAPKQTESAKREPVLVGYGVKQGTSGRRPRKAAAATASAADVMGAAVQEEPVADDVPAPAYYGQSAARETVAAAAPSTPAVLPATPAPTTGAGTKVLAKPPVRKLAKDLGVDLALVAPSGPNGTVTRDDVHAAASGSLAAVSAPSAATATASTAGTAGEPFRNGERRVPIKGVRKATAAAVVQSAFTAPHVTEFLTVDVTPTMRLVQRLKEMPDFKGVRVSPLLLVAKAFLVAMARNPEINARWDEAHGEIVYFDHVTLGIAAATPRGLIVPNIKAADTLSLVELGRSLNALTDVAREGRTALADMTGSTATITNVGVFGVDTGTPILNPGEASILAFGAVREQPWVHKGKVKPRQVTTLALSFDHRLVDGELGSKVLRDVGAVLADPLTALAWS